MLTPKGLFFAPNVRFKDLRVNDPNALADALAERAEHWFFRPARTIAGSSPFAAGIVVVCFVDAAAEFTGKDTVEWLHEAVPDSAGKDARRDQKTIAESFKEDVRNGLVHHARLNRGAEFSLDIEQLLTAVQAEWQRFIARIASEPAIHQSTAERVARVFRVDFDADAAWADAP